MPKDPALKARFIPEPSVHHWRDAGRSHRLARVRLSRAFSAGLQCNRKPGAIPQADMTRRLWRQARKVTGEHAGSL